MNKTYIETYPYLVSYCSNKHPFNIESYFQAILMVYGWMPTSFKIKGDTEDSISAINAMLEQEKPDSMLLTIAHKSVNNSIVGLSKLLHFSKPNVFPIWDSKIADRQFSIRHQYAYNKPQPYISYFNFVHDCINSERIAEIRLFAEREIPYRVSDVRATEYYIFNNKKIT